MKVLTHISNISDADWSTLASESGQYIYTTPESNLPGSAGSGLRVSVDAGQAYADSKDLTAMGMPEPEDPDGWDPSVETTWAVGFYVRFRSWSGLPDDTVPWCLSELYSPICPTAQLLLQPPGEAWESPHLAVKAIVTETGSWISDTYIDDTPIDLGRWYHLMFVGESRSDFARTELHIDRQYRGEAYRSGRADDRWPVRCRVGLYATNWASPYSPTIPFSNVEADIDEVTVATGLFPAERVTGGIVTPPAEQSIIRRAVCV